MERCRFSGPIVSAVCYEIERIARAELRGESGPGEGTAYKAAFDRLGSDALKHCDAFAHDCETAARAVKWHGYNARIMAVLADAAIVRERGRA